MTDRRFQDWSRVQRVDEGYQDGAQGVVVWDPATHEYVVFWDADTEAGEQGTWDRFAPNTTHLKEA